MIPGYFLCLTSLDDSIWHEKVIQSFHVAVENIPKPYFRETVMQSKSEGVKERVLTSSFMMKEHKKKSDWHNASSSTKVKNFYFPYVYVSLVLSFQIFLHLLNFSLFFPIFSSKKFRSYPSTVRFDSDICLISYDNIMNFYDTQSLEVIISYLFNLLIGTASISFWSSRKSMETLTELKIIQISIASNLTKTN